MIFLSFGSVFQDKIMGINIDRAKICVIHRKDLNNVEGDELIMSLIMEWIERQVDEKEGGAFRQ